MLLCCGCGGSASGLNDNQGGATLTLTADPNSVNADGISFSTITAVLTDSTGEPAQQGVQVAFTTNLGVFANGANAFSDRYGHHGDCNRHSVCRNYAE